MEFALVVGGGLIAFLLVLVGVSRYSTKSGPEILDWKPSRSFENELELEAEEVDQMIAARNERRRARGAGETSEEEFREQVRAAEQEQRARAARYRAPSGSARPGNAPLRPRWHGSS